MNNDKNNDFDYSKLDYSKSDYSILREQMVEEQIQARRITDNLIIKAMKEVPREEFVPEPLKRYAYQDMPLPIGYGQTISQPFVVAFMTASLKLYPGERILEIGTGSGYQTAILSKIAKEIFSIEIIKELAEKAQTTFKKLNYLNIQSKVSDGYEGWKEFSPYDAIMFTACLPNDFPSSFIDQLKDGGKMIAPIENMVVEQGKNKRSRNMNFISYFDQQLVLLSKENGKITRRNILPVRFVPMTTKQV